MAKNNKKGIIDEIRRIMKKEGTKLHFVGIGGVSMYSLARLSSSKDTHVSGSDREESRRTKELASLGINISIGHNAENAENKDLVVYSHAIAEDNPELVYAKDNGIPTANRAEFLGAFMTEYKKRVGISGTHGKSTTVAMLDLIFAYAGLNHTTLSGASLATGEPFRMGKKDLLLYEGCEYKDSFLRFFPNCLTVLNLDYDHPDYFESLERMKESFAKAVIKADKAIINIDDVNLKSLLKDVKNKTEIITFGQSERAKYRYRIISFEPGGCKFVIECDKEEIGVFETRVAGVYNVANAAAAAVSALENGISPSDIAPALAAFRGIEARLEYLGSFYGREIYRDYAHHPTEIRALINTLKMHSGDTVTVVFKPHTYSRTGAFFDDFKLSLSLADNVILTDIYPAREEPIEGVSSERLAEEIGSKAIYVPDEEVKNALLDLDGGAVVLMGAGDMENIKKEILKG